jgi:alkanesulfonate monooxygenase SsuD/methylene tetrahydromethanopterin reductase-like flavin-dependent oxidoreductase (luciferase family)
MSALRVGMMLPSRETAMTGRHDARGLVEFAMAADAAGFDSVWVGDSLLARTRAEPLSILSAAAAVTDRVALGTAALIAPLRHPLPAAGQAATVDQLSGGRLILGLGSGSRRPARRDGHAVATDVGRAGRVLLCASGGAVRRPTGVVGRWRHDEGHQAGVDDV